MGERNVTAETKAERRRWLALYVLCAGVLMIVLDATIVNVALPTIQDDLGLLAVEPRLGRQRLPDRRSAACCCSPGALGDLIGQRRVFLIGLAVFTGASLLCALAQSQDVLIGARFVQGIGGAMPRP